MIREERASGQIVKWPKVNPRRFTRCNACGRPNAIGMTTCLFCGLEITLGKDEKRSEKQKSHSLRFIDAGAHDNSESQGKIFPASISSRVTAFLIDRAILMAVVIPMAVKKGIIVFGTSILPLASHFPAVPRNKTIGILVFALIVDFIYNMAGEASGIQGTLGKSIVGLRTCDAKGQKIGVGDAAIRYLVKTASSFALLPLAAALDDRNQAPHDKVVDSFVVHS